MTIATITVPDEVLLATRMTREEIQLELAISLFQKEKLSFGKARELAGLDFWTVVRAISWIILRGQKRPFFPTTNHPPKTTIPTLTNGRFPAALSPSAAGYQTAPEFPGPAPAKCSLGNNRAASFAPGGEPVRKSLGCPPPPR